MARDRQIFVVWLLGLAIACGGCNSQSAPPAAEKSGGGAPTANEGSPVQADSSSATDDDVVGRGRTAIEHYRRKDLMALVEMTPPSKRPPQEIMDQLQPGGEIFNELTSDENPEWRVVNQWNGEILQARQLKSAYLLLGKSKSFVGGPGSDENDPDAWREENVCAKWIWEQGQWKFDGVFHPSDETFAQFGESLDVSRPPAGEPDQAAQDSTPVRAMQLLAEAFRQRDAAAVRQWCSSGHLADVEENGVRFERPAGETGDAAEDAAAALEMQLRILAAVWGGNELDQIVGWDGVARQAVVSHEARVQFAKVEEEAFVVELVRTGNQWWFKGFASPDQTTYDQWGDPSESP